MENIIALIATNSTPSDISDAIKTALYSKAMERVDNLRPQVSNILFDIENNNDNPE